MVGWLNPRYNVGTPPIAGPRSAPDAPFLWGPGGRRTSQDDIALQRQLAARNMLSGSDYSPVQSWTQGLARVAQGLAGGQQMHAANAAASERADAEQQIIEALLQGYDPTSGAPDPVAAALANPGTREVGMEVLKQRQPEAIEPPKDEVTRQAIIANDPTQPEWARQAARERLAVLNDPLSVITNSAGTQILPRSVLLNGQQQGPAARPAPTPEAVQELLDNPDAAAEYDEVFGPGAAAEVFAARQGFTQFIEQQGRR